MANGDDVTVWAKMLGMLLALIGSPVAVVKATTLSKKEYEMKHEKLKEAIKNDREKCQDKIYHELQSVREEMQQTNNKQTAWIMAIAIKAGVTKEDIREL